MNFNESINAKIYVQHIKAQSQNFNIYAAVHENIYSLSEGLDTLIAQSKIRERITGVF